MKFHNLFIILSIALSSLAMAKTSYLDMEKVLKAYSKTDGIKAEYDSIESSRKQSLTQIKIMEENLRKTAKELDDLKKELEKNEDSWSEEKYDLQKQKIAVKSRSFLTGKRELDAYKQSSYGKLQSLHRDLRKKMIDQIREKIAVYAKEKKLEAVYYTEATAYWDSKLEITAEIIQIVNPGYKEEAEEKKDDKKVVNPGK